MTDVDAHHGELKRLAVLYWLGLSDSVAVKSWTSAEYEHNADPDPNLPRLYADDNDTGALLTKMAQSQLDFLPASPAGIQVAQSILASYLQRFLNKEITPHNLCGLVKRIDGRFLDAIPTDDPNVAYYPEWLGDLWNCCDYCDATWTYDSASHLVQECQVVLGQLAGQRSVP